MDIAKCFGNGCPWPTRVKCFRFSAPPGEYQKYFKKFPGKISKGKGFTCKQFWLNPEGRKIEDIKNKKDD